MYLHRHRSPMMIEMLNTNVVLGKSSYLIHSLLTWPLLVVHAVLPKLLPLLLLAASISLYRILSFFVPYRLCFCNVA